MILDTNFLKFQNSLGSSSPYQCSILISTRLKKEKKRITETLESLKLWFAALISRFHPRFREHGCWKHVADSSPISRNFKRRGTQNERARILNEIQRERERVARESIASFARDTDCWICCSSFRFTNVAARLPRDLDRPHGKWELEPIRVTPPCFFLSLLESLRAEIAFRLFVRN